MSDLAQQLYEASIRERVEATLSLTKHHPHAAPVKVRAWVDLPERTRRYWRNEATALFLRRAYGSHERG